MIKFCKRMAFLGIFCTLNSQAAPTLPPTYAIPPPPPSIVSEFRTFGAGLPLAEFLKITIGEVIGAPFVLTPAAAGDTALISADLKKLKKQEVKQTLEIVLNASGYALSIIGGVYIVDKKKEEKEGKEGKEEIKEIMIYKPKHRPINTLYSYFNVFPGLSFSFGQGIAAKAMGSESVATSKGDPNGKLGSSFETGATTLSQSNGDPALLVVRGDKKTLEKFSDYMELIDTPITEVVVRAYVLEVRESKSKQDGLALAMNILNDKLSLNLGNIPGGDTFKINAGGVALSAVIAALKSDSRVKLMSSPILRVADGSKASSAIGTETPTLGSVTTSNGQTTQSIVYQSAGVLLSVAPRIMSDSIRLQVSQEISSFIATDTGLKTTPTKLRRAFNTDTIAKDGDMILLGGLSETSTAKSENRSLFGLGYEGAEDSKSEIIVLLSVNLVKN